MIRAGRALLAIALAVFAPSGVVWGAESPADEGPAADLPPHIQRLTLFGERADWSHDGRRILFIEKTYGDAYEIEIESGDLRLLTGHYPHSGYTRALYLSNGHVLLSGAPRFDPADPGWSRGARAAAPVPVCSGSTTHSSAARRSRSESRAPHRGSRPSSASATRRP